MRRRAGAFKPLGSALAGALGSVNKSGLLSFARIERRWEDIVGSRLAAVSRPGALSRKSLTIWVSEPVWTDSMLYLRSEIIAKINEVVGDNLVDSIRVVMKRGDDADRQDAGGKTVAEPAVEISETDLVEIERAMENTPDSQLRSIFKRVMLKNIEVESRRSRRK